MKITGQNPQRAGELAGGKAAEVEPKAKARPSSPPEAAGKAQARPTLTLDKVKDAIRQEPDIRAERVADLKERVAGGKFTVDENRLAANLINASLREDLERP
jgi:flagellar biosynthesis anti-sigma factor FlgM